MTAEDAAPGIGVMLTYKFRIKDRTSSKNLRKAAWSCNQVWNYCCEVQRQSESRWRAGRSVRWPTAFDLINLCSGGSTELGIHSDTIGALCRQFVVSRQSLKRCPGFRAGRGSRRSLGWIPFRGRSVKIDGAAVRYLGRRFCFWMSRHILGSVRSGAFVEDGRGRWYVVFQCEVADALPTGAGEVGIDLGLNTLAVCSDGTIVPALQHYRRYEGRLSVAQRAKNRRRVKAIHAKIANARRHHLHEQSTRIVRNNKLIVVGNVSASKLAKTKMAKSVLDAAWSTFRNQLRYKARRHGARYVEVDEGSSSATCSDCLSVSGPKGIAGMRVRHWECSCCGASHDRDVNAARNILRVGLERQAPAVEVAAGNGSEDVNTPLVATSSRP